MSSKETKQTKQSSGIWETVKTVIYAVLIALVVRTIAYEPFNIPSGSMIPTLLVGDYLFVAKYSYGYSRYSLPFSLPVIPGRLFFRPPERGDVAVFKLPRDNSTDYIKRIIGLPGDKIQVRDGVLYINDEAVKRARVDDYVAINRLGNAYRTAQYIETLSNGTRYLVLDANPNGRYDNTEVFNVPEGHYFAMGDNRDNSLDSRVASGVGFIPSANLVGRADVIFFSTNGGARIWEIWNWPKALRFSRFFSAIT